MDLDKVMTKLNPWMVRLLESRGHGLLSYAFMVIHVQGVKSGKQYKIPVGYQVDGNKIRVLVSKARRKNWWRNYIKGAPVYITIKGERISGQASLLSKDNEQFKNFIVATFKRVPGLSKQFGIGRVSSNLSAVEWEMVKKNRLPLILSVISRDFSCHSELFYSGYNSYTF